MEESINLADDAQLLPFSFASNHLILADLRVDKGVKIWTCDQTKLEAINEITRKYEAGEINRFQRKSMTFYEKYSNIDQYGSKSMKTINKQ